MAVAIGLSGWRGISVAGSAAVLGFSGKRADLKILRETDEFLVLEDADGEPGRCTWANSIRPW